MTKELLYKYLMQQVAPKAIGAIVNGGNFKNAPTLTAPEQFAANPINDAATQALLHEDLFENLPSEVYEQDSGILGDSDALNDMFIKASMDDEDYNKIPQMAEGLDFGDDWEDGTDSMDDPKKQMFAYLIKKGLK